jgi:hypothetical protein
MPLYVALDEACIEKIRLRYTAGACNQGKRVSVDVVAQFDAARHGEADCKKVATWPAAVRSGNAPGAPPAIGERCCKSACRVMNHFSASSSTT